MARRLLFCAAAVLLLAVAQAELPEWQELVARIVQLPAPNGYNDQTSRVFSRNLATFEAARDTTDTNFVYPKWIKDFFPKLRALKTAYNKPTGADTRPHVVIVGAGPMGLATALLIAKKGSHRVTVIEKSNGKDPRWNAILAQNEFKTIFTADLGVRFSTGDPWIGALPEFEYAMGAILLLMGVEIKYNTMYLQVCADSENKHTVHTVLTPHGDDKKEQRYLTYKTEDICGDNRDTYLASKTLTGHEAIPVDIIIGADGTQSSVRKTMFLADAVTGTNDRDKTFPALVKTAGEFVGTTTKFEAVLHKDGVVSDALLTHVIVSFGVETLKSGETEVALQGAGATRTVTPLDPPLLGPLLLKKTLTQREFSDLISSGIPHKMLYINEAGEEKWRVYVELLLRHEASKTFRTAFKDAVGDTDLLVSMAHGMPINDLAEDTDGEDHAMSPKQKAALGQKLLPILYKFLSTGVGREAGREETFHKVFPTQERFNELIDKIKIFDQSVRGAVKVASKKTGLRTILIGDATRDSYYAFGNSINSAYTAIVQHIDALLGDEGGFDAAATAYKTQVVDQFINFIGSDIYMRTFCGCKPETGGVPLKELKFESVSCPAALPDPPATPPPKKRKLLGKKDTTPALQPRTGELPPGTCPATKFEHTITVQDECNFSKLDNFAAKITQSFCDKI